MKKKATENFVVEEDLLKIVERIYRIKYFIKIKQKPCCFQTGPLVNDKSFLVMHLQLT